MTSTETTATPDLARITRASRSVDGARQRLHDAVKEASGQGASLRQLAGAAGCSVEQVRRILDGRAKPT